MPPPFTVGDAGDRGDRRSVAGYCYDDDHSVYDRSRHLRHHTCISDIQTTEEIKTYHLKQSRKLPPWIWYILAKSLGLRLHQSDQSKPWVGTLFNILTLALALLYAVTKSWFTGYDIVSAYTKQTLLKGSVEIFVGLTWCSLGIYANKLAGNLFHMPKFLDSVRLHSKTICKINSAMIMIVSALTFVVINSFKTLYIYEDAYCNTVGLPTLLCKVMYVSKVAYAVLAVFWNLLVGIVLLSVCRTHTIGIRRFIKEMEEDGKNCILSKQIHRFHGPSRKYSARPSVTSDDLMWDDEFNPFTDEIFSRSHESQNLNAHMDAHLQTSTEISTLHPKESKDNNETLENSFDIGDQQKETLQENIPLEIPSDPPSPVTPTEPILQFNDSTNDVFQPRLFTNNEILLGYYKISCRLRGTSICLQRWLASWVFFIMVWSATYIIYWLTHDATVLGVMEFIIPLLLLPLVSSAFAEVNSEGFRLSKCICLLEERKDMLHIIKNHPLEMTVFGFPLDYSIIVKVMGAVVLAFSSRIILDEVFPPNTSSTRQPLHNTSIN